MTLCISNGGQSAINEPYMNKVNGGANMKVCAEEHRQAKSPPLNLKETMKL